MFLGFVVILGFGASALFPYPLHASCKIQWVSSLQCQEVKSKLMNQINEWSHGNCPNVSDSCPKMPCGQKCNYELTDSSKENELKCLHKTPKKQYIDYLTFDFQDDGAEGCKFEGYSTSGVWYAVLDFGTNYCNLRNLIDGSGISASDGFSETTKNSVCTQYTSRDCERF